MSFRPQAKRDVLDQMLYLEEQSNEKTAIRYYDAVWATCYMLADQPLCGKAFKTRNIRLEGLRRFPVAGSFQEYLIFYRPTQPGVEIVRVVHGFRDIEAILVEENGG